MNLLNRQPPNMAAAHNSAIQAHLWRGRDSENVLTNFVDIER